jgi:cell division protein FtsQ
MKPGWKWLAGGIAAAVLVAAAPAAGRRLAFFRVRRVEVVGTRNLSPRAVLAAMRLSRTASVFDDTGPLARRVAALGGVTAARVRRRLPGGLRVEVDEVLPVALVPRGAGMALVDARGRVLPFDPSRAAPDLPILAAPDSLVATLLARMREGNPVLFAQVAAAWRAGDDVTLEANGRRLLFRPDATSEEMHAVMAVAQDLARKGRSYAELDGRFAGQVVVRWGRG